MASIPTPFICGVPPPPDKEGSVNLCNFGYKPLTPVPSVLIYFKAKMVNCNIAKLLILMILQQNSGL